MTEISALQHSEKLLTASDIHDALREVLADIALDTDADALMVTRVSLEEACGKLVESPDLAADRAERSALVKTLRKIKDMSAKRLALDDARADWAVSRGGKLEHGRRSWQMLLKSTARAPDLRNMVRNQDLLATAVLLPHGASLILERWRRDVDAIANGFAEVSTGDLVLKRVSSPLRCLLKLVDMSRQPSTGFTAESAWYRVGAITRSCQARSMMGAMSRYVFCSSP